MTEIIIYPSCMSSTPINNDGIIAIRIIKELLTSLNKFISAYFDAKMVFTRYMLILLIVSPQTTASILIWIVVNIKSNNIPHL